MAGGMRPQVALSRIPVLVTSAMYNDEVVAGSVPNTSEIRGMLAVYFPDALYKIAEVSDIGLRHVRAETSQNFGSVHLGEVLFSSTGGLGLE
jgi:hypothetical protein